MQGRFLLVWGFVQCEFRREIGISVLDRCCSFQFLLHFLKILLNYSTVLN